MHEKTDVCGLTVIELAELERAEEIKREKTQAVTSKDENEQGFLISDSSTSLSA